MTDRPSPSISGLYKGTVTHHRLRPRDHLLAYRVFYTLFDLDELDELHRSLRLFSHNAFNLLSFHDSDHLDGENAEPLRRRVDRLIEKSGFAPADGPVRLLTMPRVFGHAFNPLSIFFCHGASGDLRFMLYQVNNTFGQRHSYLLPVADGDGDIIEQTCAKRFYVSPFLDLDLVYRFRIEAPAETVSVGVTASDATGPIIATAFKGRRQPLSDRAILAAIAGCPLLGLKVLAGIHWEALQIWMKGIKVRSRPAPPDQTVTVTMPAERSPAS